MKKDNLLLVGFLIILFTQGCGYKPVYSSKNLSFGINKIQHENNKLNFQIVRSLKSLSNENASNNIDLELKSKKEKRIISKNKSGDPEIFELMIVIDIIIQEKQKTFVTKQNYNNKENKFELNEYEIEIEKQLINEIIDDILLYLAKL